MSYPLSGRLDISQRVAWMRALLPWAEVNAGLYYGLLTVECKPGTPRPHP
jgi:hypothetical protein